jgi:SAM-dependent methyltransferase
MTKPVWKDYFELTKGRPPKPLLVEALGFVEDKNQAIDLGSGALNDSMFLLDEGFNKVIALDKESIAEEVSALLPKDRFEYVIASMEEYTFDLKFDLINAQYSLPFVAPANFDRVLKEVISSLSVDGIFVGQLFGEHDEWSKNPNMTFHTKSNALNLFSGLEVIKFNEIEKEGKTAAGTMKHWHLFEFIVRKK